MTATQFEVLGIVLHWELRGSETGNKYCVLNATVPPGCMVPPHQHREQEAFYMLEGEAEFAELEGGELVWKTARPGQMVNIPPDSVHGFRNASSAPDANIEKFFVEAGTPVAPVAAPPTMEAIERVLAIAQKHGQRFLPPPAMA